MKNSSDTIGNRTRDLLACSAVPQPTVPPRAPLSSNVDPKFNLGKGSQTQIARVARHFKQ